MRVSLSCIVGLHLITFGIWWNSGQRLESLQWPEPRVAWQAGRAWLGRFSSNYNQPDDPKITPHFIRKVLGQFCKYNYSVLKKYSNDEFYRHFRRRKELWGRIAAIKDGWVYFRFSVIDHFKCHSKITNTFGFWVGNNLGQSCSHMYIYKLYKPLSTFYFWNFIYLKYLSFSFELETWPEV